MPNIGPMELVIVLSIALLVLGPKRLPQAGRSLGKGLREFKQGLSGLATADEESKPGLAMVEVESAAVKTD
jgi:sec-independent protein translocase protein TatA